MPAGSDEKQCRKNREKLVGPIMLWHNKVLRNIEIFDFVIFRDGSYYSLFSCLDLRKRNVHYELIFLKNAQLFRSY